MIRKFSSKWIDSIHSPFISRKIYTFLIPSLSISFSNSHSSNNNTFSNINNNKSIILISLRILHLLTGWYQNIQTHHTKHNHHQINQVLPNSSAISLSAESRQYEKQRNPYHQLVPHEHACAAQKEWYERCSIGLLLEVETFGIEIGDSVGVFVRWHVFGLIEGGFLLIDWWKDYK